MHSALVCLALLAETKPWYRTPEWVAVALTTVYVVFTGVYVLFSWLTLSKIEEQIQLTREQGKSSEEQFAHQIAVMNGQLRAMQTASEQAARQVSAINSTASATQESAYAVKASTESAKNSERAWLIPTLDWNKAKTKMKLGNSSHVMDGKQVEGSFAFVRIVIENAGKTPAWITAKKIGMAILDTLPPLPDFGRMAVIDPLPEPLPAGKSVTWGCEPGCEGGEEPGKTTIIYGVVEYVDIFGENRYSRFGYVVTPSHDLERIPTYLDYNQFK